MDHAVFATDFNHKVFRVSDPCTWDQAQARWNKLDTLWREGLLPQWKHFEVRSVRVDSEDRPLVGPRIYSHGQYDQAEIGFVTPVTNPRGFKTVESASRAAWKAFTGGTFTARKPWHRGVQGFGGWYYWPNGRTAAQGLHSLAVLCQQKKMVVQGGNGRWYVYRAEGSL